MFAAPSSMLSKKKKGKSSKDVENIIGTGPRSSAGVASSSSSNSHPHSGHGGAERRATTPTTAASTSVSPAAPRRFRMTDTYPHVTVVHNHIQQPQNNPPPTEKAKQPDQVVVGIAASVEDGVEDWSEDFVDSTETGSTAVTPPRRSNSSTLHRPSTTFQRPASMHRWQRQHSLDSAVADLRDSYRSSGRSRKSSSDVSSNVSSNVELRGTLAEVKEHPRSVSEGSDHSDSIEKDEQERTRSRSAIGSVSVDEQKEELTAGGHINVDGLDDDDDDEEDEDWDAEFGFNAENSEDEQLESLTAITADQTRRRAANFNIFLEHIHNMMDGEDLLEDENDEGVPGKPLRARRHSEEPLFQRRRSDMGGNTENASVDGIRISLSSASGVPVEYRLVDKYRLLEVASSSAYSVRIERYPKPPTTFSNLEKSDNGGVGRFSSFTENKFERWLETIVSHSCAQVREVMEKERQQVNPRQQKNHQFRTLVSLPFGKEFVVNFFKQVSFYRYFGEEKSNRELVRVFFEKVSTAGMMHENWAATVSRQDYHFVAGCTMEILQEAARMYGPNPASSVVGGMHILTTAQSSGSSATAFWMCQFHSILKTCAETFPDYRNVIALIELRYVCHHLVGFASSDFGYTWQICNHLPPFCPLEPIAGESAPIIANEILEYYGALFGHLNTSPESRGRPYEEQTAATESQDNDEQHEVLFGLSPDVICLQALVLCDIQSLYESKSVLAEVSIPAMVELFEFEDDDMQGDPLLAGLVPTGHNNRRSSNSSREAQDNTFQTGARSSGLGGWSSGARLFALLRPSCRTRSSALMFFYERILTTSAPLIKAKCASTLAGMHISGASFGNLRDAESLAYEVVRLLEACSNKKLADLKTDEATTGKPFILSMFSNDGLLSDLGRESLEILGSVLIKNQKYRYGILCLEAAGTLFGFLNQGMEYEKLNRLLCGITLQFDDVQRALPLHEKVAASAQRQGNFNEFVYLTQALTNLWIREGNFARAEEYLSSAFTFLRDHTNVLAPSFLASTMNGAYSTSEAVTTSSRSGTMMTATSSSASSSLSGSFHISSRSTGNTSEMDTWLSHDIALHLQVREVYRSSGRCLEGMRVLDHLLNYSVRLPRGKRTQLRMLLAEDALKMRMFDTCQYMLSLLDQEAKSFCDRLRENFMGSTGFSSSGGSNSGRGMGGMGSEARYCFDMVLSLRYILCRAKLFLQLGEHMDAFAWLSLAHIKNDQENLGKQAKLYFLDGIVLQELCREHHDAKVAVSQRSSSISSSKSISLQGQIEDTLKSFAASLYSLTALENERLHERMVLFRDCATQIEKAEEYGLKSLWTAFDQYEAVDNNFHQVKTMLAIIQFLLAPIERSFFALGSIQDDELLKSYLRRNMTNSGSVSEFGEDSTIGGDLIIEKTRKTLLDAQKLLRRAISLAEQVADPTNFLRTLIMCSEVWLWLERIASYKSEKHIKEAATFWEEAVRILKAVFLRRVAFQNAVEIQNHQMALARGFMTPQVYGISGTYCVVPILNFSESFIVKLESMTLQLIVTACQLQQFERVPEYVEEMLLMHLDELLSAHLCLSTISHKFKVFRGLQRPQKRVALSATALSSTSSTPVPVTPMSSTSGVIVEGSSRAASFSSTASSPGITPGGNGTPSSNSAAKRKGHKKNQSMSSISELLTMNGSSTPSSFHDISSSFGAGSSSRGGSSLTSAATPRTGLASLNDRSNVPHGKIVTTTTAIFPRGVRNHVGFERNFLRTRGRSRSAPQPVVPNQPSNSESSLSPNNKDQAEQPVDEVEKGAVLGRSPIEKIMDLSDVRMWPETEGILDGDDAFRGKEDGSSSAGLGLYDFDEVQSEKLWWIFNMWRHSKAKYVNGKIDITAFRAQNLRCLRTLLDAFDPQQVAVLCVNECGSISSTANSSCGDSNIARPSTTGMLGFDVAHMSSHALIQDKQLVLSIGFDVAKSPRFGFSHLKFKVFYVSDGETLAWRQQIPRPNYFLEHYDLAEAESASSGAGVFKTFRLLSAKLLLKLIGLLLLENSVVVVGTSFTQIKEVTLALVKLLEPFRWQHTLLPFLPIASWRLLYDSAFQYTQTQLAARPRGRGSLSRLSHEWRWGGGSSGRPSMPVNILPGGYDEPPFLIGTTIETWQCCLQYAKHHGTDSRAVLACVNVVDLDNLDVFTTAKGNPNAVSLPRKWRKQFLEKFDKVVKSRRKVQIKMGRRLARQGFATTSTPTVATPLSAQSPVVDLSQRSFDDSRSSRSTHLWASHTDGSTTPSSLTDSQSFDERVHYDAECFAAFRNGIYEFYEKIVSLCEEKDRKSKGKKKSSGPSKRQEIKAWFSSTHDFDGFVDRFQESQVYQEYVKDQGANGSSTSIRAFPGGGMKDTAALASAFASHSMKSFGSLSSTSSGTGATSFGL